MGTWLNPDGLELKFGTSKTNPAILGEYRYDGPRRVVEIHLDWTQMPAVASNSVLIEDSVTFPIGATFEAVEIFTYTDFTSASSDLTLNVGYINTDRTNGATVDAFVVAATLTEINTGGTNISGWVGAAVGAVPLTVPKLLTWEVDAHAATAGEGVIRIYYSVA